MARRRELSPSDINRQDLESTWPPDWMTTYSDMATLLMTFFIILSTMLALRIDITWLSGEEQIETPEEERPLGQTILRDFNEEQKNLIEKFKNLEHQQLRELITISKVQQLGRDIEQYILEANLSAFIKVDTSKWKVTIIPLVPFLFPPARAALKQSARDFLDRIAKFIQINPCRIRILGHTDNLPIHTPVFPSNWELSAARATAIMRYLIEKHGIEAEKLSAIGYGPHHPVASNDTEEGRAKNRRVEIEIIQRPGMTELEGLGG